MDQDFQTHKDKLRQQIEELYGKLLYTYVTHICNALYLQKDNNRLKWIQIILSAISTGGFIATVVKDDVKLAWIGGILSTILLVISSYTKDKDFNGEKKEHLKIADELWPLREEYISLLTDFDSLEEDAIVKKRDELKTKTSKIYNGAIQTDIRSYKAAQDMIKNREHQFFSREELNKMLPIHLRRT